MYSGVPREVEETGIRLSQEFWYYVLRRVPSEIEVTGVSALAKEFW